MPSRALGLDIELPNVNSRDMAYWREVHRVGWKPQLRGKIHDTEEEWGDPAWCSLMVLPFYEVRFDLEEGIKFSTTVGNLLPTLDLAYGLVSRGLVPLDRASDPYVWVMQCEAGYDVPDPQEAYRAVGLKWKQNLTWVMDLQRWPLPAQT